MISYQYLAAAQSRYEELGYTSIDVPWWATRDIVNLVKSPGLPKDNEYELSLNKKCLVGSGEQGFLYMANKGQLPTGVYQTITPCFRNEPHDAFHQKQFMKLELIEYTNAPHPGSVLPNNDALNQRIEKVVHDAYKTFDHIANQKMQMRIVQTDEPHPARVPATFGYDIEGKYQDQWIELGSYGARRAVFGIWIFGTGLAEPRFSKLLHASSF